jgi:outer membrane protein assembly factor BamD
MRFNFRCLALLLFIFAVQGCATVPVNKTIEELMTEGEQLQSSGKYERAVEAWKKVRDKYPSPEISAKAQLAIADSYYSNKEFIESAVEYEGFIKLHQTCQSRLCPFPPGNEQLQADQGD